MKRVLIFLIILSATSYAQEEPYSLSSHFGYSLSNSMYANGQTDLKSTFNAGIEIRKQISQKGFHLQSGIRWNEYGFRDLFESFILWDDYAEVVNIDYRSTSFYLSIPLIATYKFKKTIPGLTLSAGPQVSFYLFNKSRYNEDINFYISNYHPLLNLGLYFSAGYEHTIGERWIIGGEAYSNLNLPVSSSFGSEGAYNFGIAISGRYILKNKDKG